MRTRSTTLVMTLLLVLATFLGAPTAAAAVGPQTLTGPVSYTHLDVYKRQILVLAHPEDFRDEDWCGLDTYAARPVDRDVGASGDGVGEPRSDPAGGPASD